MLGEYVRGHARQHRTADAQVRVGTILFENQGICRLLNSVVQEFVGALLTEDEPGVDGFPDRRMNRLLRVPLNQTRVATSATLPRQATSFRASWVKPESRFSFSTMRSTTLSV